METTSKTTESFGLEPTESMKKAMDIGSVFTGLEVTFLFDANSRELPYTTVTAGCTLEILGMIQSSDQKNWTVELGLETDDVHNLPMVFTIGQLFELTDLHFVLSTVGGLDLAKVYFPRYV